MNSWDTKEAGRDARADATIKFCKHLKDLPEAERKKYTVPNVDEQAASKEARKLFADLGGFYLEENHNNPADKAPIPANLQFRIYELGYPADSPDKPKFADRDDIVALVLPRPGQNPSVNPDKHYRCSYWPY